MWQFGEAVRGIGEACRALDVPITGGNVSLYNETEGRAIYPTPVLGVVGLLADASKTVTRVFQAAGAAVVVLGENLWRAWRLASTSPGCSTGSQGQPPALDLAARACAAGADRDAAYATGWCSRRTTAPTADSR